MVITSSPHLPTMPGAFQLTGQGVCSQLSRQQIPVVTACPTSRLLSQIQGLNSSEDHWNSGWNGLRSQLQAVIDKLMDVFVGSALERSGAVFQGHKVNRPGASSERNSAAPAFPEEARDGAFSQRQRTQGLHS